MINKAKVICVVIKKKYSFFFLFCFWLNSGCNRNIFKGGLERLKRPNNGLNHSLSMTNHMILPRVSIVQVLEFLVFYSDPRVIINQISSKSNKKNVYSLKGIQPSQTHSFKHTD